jgi:hypothetical protein
MPRHGYSGDIEEPYSVSSCCLVCCALWSAVAGGSDLAQRILSAPIQLRGGAASQDFLAETSQQSVARLLPLFRKAALRFLPLGRLGMAPILVAVRTFLRSYSESH